MAVDSSLPQAMLAATIYVASSAATPAGLQQLRCMLSEWLTSPSAAAKASEGTAAPGDNSQGEDAAAASRVPPDSYLQAATVPDRWAPMVTFVAVPALPKGALVEVQPTAVRASGGPSNNRRTAGLAVCCCEVGGWDHHPHLQCFPDAVSDSSGPSNKALICSPGQPGDGLPAST